MDDSHSQTSNDTLLRQWEMLLHIPAHPARRSTSQIAHHLSQQGYHVTTRTVQRDLDKLSAIMPFANEADGRTNYWFFPREQRLLEIPGMSSAVALALILAREQCNSLLPPTTLNLLNPYFAKAEQVLKEAVPRSLSNWRRRIKVIQKGPKLKSPKIAEHIQQSVYAAVLEGEQLNVTYRGRDRTTEQLLHPQALVLRDGVMYLVASAWNYGDARHYALHRIKTALRINEAAKRVVNFDLDSYAEETFRYPVSPSLVPLKLRMDAKAAYHLAERPLSDDQLLSISEDVAEISATVADTDELRWWLLGFGEQVEVLGPKKLRDEIRRRVRAAAAQYG